MLHSFEFKEAQQRFAELGRKDPNCSIAEGSIALAETEPTGADASQKSLAEGWNQLQPGLSVKARTAREEMYVDASYADLLHRCLLQAEAAVQSAEGKPEGYPGP